MMSCPANLWKYSSLKKTKPVGKSEQFNVRISLKKKKAAEDQPGTNGKEEAKG